MNKNILNVQVEKADIKKIGNTAYNEDGFLAIICDSDTANIEEILLRNILKCFGEEYKIVSAEDFEWDGVDGCDICFTTNLPYELFEEVWHSEDSYIDEDVEVEIVCPEHGSFRVTPKDHLNGVGCPHCEKSAKQPKTNKIVKSILTIIMLVFIGLAANAQEVHGYSKYIAIKLCDDGFAFVNSGYMDEKIDGIHDLYRVTTATPEYYDEEQTQLAVDNLLNQYSDVILYEPWHEKQWKKQSLICCGYEATYVLCGDTQLTVTIFNAAQFTNRCYVYLNECLIEELCKH